MKTSNIVNLADARNLDVQAVLHELNNLANERKISGLIYIARTDSGKTFSGTLGLFKKDPVEAMVESSLLFLDCEKRAKDDVVKKITEYKSRSGKVTAGDKTISYHFFGEMLIASDGENEKLVPFDADKSHPAKVAKALFSITNT